MHPHTPHAQTAPPAFGYLSPHIDSADDASDDGESLQTPLTDHDHPHTHQPYAVYHQHAFNASPVHPYSSPEHHSSRDAFNKAHSGRTSFSNLLEPSATEKLASGSLDSFFPYSSLPPNALDLANASLEFDPFAASFGASMDLDHRPLNTSSPCVDPPANLPPLPALTVDSLADICSSPSVQSLLFEPPPTRPSLLRTFQSENLTLRRARLYSPRFPDHHLLNSVFVHTYLLGDELGAGGYGFVMTARHLERGHEVAVKFIIKNKVPEHCWWQDEVLGRVPTEVLVMSLLNHRHIVKCLDLFEDELYFYLVQELHGTPWVSRKKLRKEKQLTAPGNLPVPSPALSPPSLTPSPSTDSDASILGTPPPQLHIEHMDDTFPPHPQDIVASSSSSLSPFPVSLSLPEAKKVSRKAEDALLHPEPRPNFSRRPSYDLFECIEQSKHKRLSENQARYIFAQVVEAVYYLDSQGITHCDIKDENLVVDKDLNVKLIDFGSAVVADPSEPRPYYNLFFGTTAYAASEILQKKPYLAPPAEIWTLGVLLSYLLTGNSPFPTEQDAIDARIVIKESVRGKLSRAAVGLMGRCLERDPTKRAGVREVREHRWLKGAFERGVLSAERDLE